jgi:hypothetical protein
MPSSSRKPEPAGGIKRVGATEIQRKRPSSTVYPD